ncbi:MAG: hypothetical protein WA058_00505 [Minisyncoccia bacterium]
MTTLHDTTEVALKTAPALVMTAWSFWGFTLNEWAAITAIVYTALMTIFLLVDRFKKWRKEYESV